uniref:Uncharacterized protein n=1 Tax=Rhizophora mucronata TaxID=61149 RepID=A0A2P2K2I3_RHIMU
MRYFYASGCFYFCDLNCFFGTFSLFLPFFFFLVLYK